MAFLPYFNVEVRTRDAVDIAYLKRKHRGRVPQVVQLWARRDGITPASSRAAAASSRAHCSSMVYAGSDVEEFSSEQAARFAEDFDAWAGRQPSALTAQAFDAATLVLQARAEVAGATARSARTDRRQGRALRAAMRPGTDPSQPARRSVWTARMTASGALDRRAVLLRVDGGTFVLHEY